MARIVYKVKLSENFLQLLSALIIIVVIGISYLPIHIAIKIAGYVICFILNFKLIKEKVHGHEANEEKVEALRKIRKERALAKLSEETYNKIKDFVIENQRASASLIERTFDLSWSAADAVIDKLYEEGVVGEVCDYEPRKVLVKKEENK